MYKISFEGVVALKRAGVVPTFPTEYLSLRERVEYTVRNIETTLTLFQSQHSLKTDLYTLLYPQVDYLVLIVTFLEHVYRYLFLLSRKWLSNIFSNMNLGSLFQFSIGV